MEVWLRNELASEDDAAADEDAKGSRRSRKRVRHPMHDDRDGLKKKAGTLIIR